MLEASGSTIEHHRTHVVVSTPTNPRFRWGNFILLPRRPSTHEIPGWIRTFAEQLPGLGHTTFGVDDPHGHLSDLAPLAKAGFATSALTVLTCTQVRAPRGGLDLEVRALESDEDWEQRIALALADVPATEIDYPAFVRARAAAERARTRHNGAWLGAFRGTELVGALGIFTAGTEVARYQEVTTHPAMRRRGVAGTLIHAAAEFAHTALGAPTVVIVAEPDYPAIRLYRELGFVDAEVQLQADRR